MKSIIQKLSVHPTYSKFYSWSKLITITGSAQIIVQATTLLSGIIIIRLLSTQEYALYTLANAVFGTMTVLADSGVSTGVMSQGGQNWQNKEKLGAVLSTGMSLRRRFAIYSLAIAIPILIYFLIQNHASALSIILIVCSIIPAFYSALSDSLLETILKLDQRITDIQKNQVSVNLLRLFLSSVSLFFFPFTFVALLSSGIPRILGNIKLRKIANQSANFKQPVDNEIKTNILKIVKRSLPEIIYYSLSGHITIWFLSIFGRTTSIAQLGALGRLGMVLNVFVVVSGTLIVPRFAKLPKSDKLLSYFIKILSGIVTLCLLIILFVWIFSKYILLILGSKYINLNYELVIYMIASCANLCIAISFGLYSSRGLVIKPTIAVTCNLLFLIVGILCFDMTSIRGVLWFNLFIASCVLALHLIFALKKLKTEH